MPDVCQAHAEQGLGKKCGGKNNFSFPATLPVLDFGGPFQRKRGRGKKLQKVQKCLDKYMDIKRNRGVWAKYRKWD